MQKQIDFNGQKPAEAKKKAEKLTLARLERKPCADLLFAELRRIKSSNTTRRYLATVIEVLTAMPRELIEDGFSELAADKSFSQKMRDKFRAVIASGAGMGDDWF